MQKELSLIFEVIVGVMVMRKVMECIHVSMERHTEHVLAHCCKGGHSVPASDRDHRIGIFCQC